MDIIRGLPTGKTDPWTLWDIFSDIGSLVKLIHLKHISLAAEY